MSTTTRTQFAQRFEGKSINLQTAELTNAQRTALQKADVNGDGKLEGTGEIDKAFTRLDDFDRNGSRNSVNAGTAARPSTTSSERPLLPRVAASAAQRGLHRSLNEPAGRHQMASPRSKARRGPVSVISW